MKKHTKHKELMNYTYFNYDRWLQLMRRMGLDDNRKTFDDVISLYAEKHRRYHNAIHIDATLKHFDIVKEQIQKPDLVELSLWFHDVIYQPFSKSNELDSANYAVQFLQNNNVPSGVQRCVFDLIMATIHDAKTSSDDQAWLVDIDLSILGAKGDVYQKFSKGVRFEYRRVPFFLYKKKRKEVLNGFLQRDYIYFTRFFREKFESQARSNMINEMQSL